MKQFTFCESFKNKLFEHLAQFFLVQKYHEKESREGVRKTKEFQ